MPYPVLCLLLGLVIGWIPYFLHGPIPEKFDLLYLKGAVGVWCWYMARLLIGFLMMLPPGLMSLAIPTCGPWCMFWNETTATSAGFIVAGLAFWLTGKHHALDRADAAPPSAV